MQTNQNTAEAELPDTELQELMVLLEEQERRKKFHQITEYFPDTGEYAREKYPKHLEFMRMGKFKSERAFIAANRIGKSYAGAYELVCHLTGIYPEWWEGRTFDRPVKAWACGLSAKQLTESMQEILFGGFTEDTKGTGLLPRDSITDKDGNFMTWNMPGVPNCIGTAMVNHISGEKSKVEFRMYEQGYGKFQGAQRDVIWLDEEPPDPKVYEECLMRTSGSAGNEGIVYCTFTPLLGLSEVVLSFLPQGRIPESGSAPETPHKWAVQATWDDVPHISEAWKKKMLSSMRPHQRAARSKGIPGMGAGQIYPIDEDTVLVEPFAIPMWWPRAYGLDVGWNRTAAIWGAMDPDTRQIYLYSEHYVAHQPPPIHASAIKERGNWIYGAIDPASGGRAQADGVKLIDLYNEEGLLIVPANNALETGIARIQNLFVTGQLKAFTSLQNWIKEIRTYRRDEDGKIVPKQQDHLLDAMRYLIMSFDEISMALPDPDEERPTQDNSSGRDDVTGY